MCTVLYLHVQWSYHTVFYRYNMHILTTFNISVLYVDVNKWKCTDTVVQYCIFILYYNTGIILVYTGTVLTPSTTCTHIQYRFLWERVCCVRVRVRGSECEWVWVWVWVCACACVSVSAFGVWVRVCVCVCVCVCVSERERVIDWEGLGLARARARTHTHTHALPLTHTHTQTHTYTLAHTHTL